MNYEHGVQMQGKWGLFEPTRFVYAFFAFNMIYAIDWKLTLIENRLKYQRTSSENYAKDQFLSVIDFVFNHENKGKVCQINPNNFGTFADLRDKKINQIINL
jgi:hypothetical protein